MCTARNDISDSDDWSRGVYAGFVTIFFTYTTVCPHCRTVLQLRWRDDAVFLVSQHEVDARAQRQLAQRGSPTFSLCFAAIFSCSMPVPQHEDEYVLQAGDQELRPEDEYKKTWRTYFKLIGATKGYVIGWAWSEYFENLLIGRDFGRIHVDYTVYTGGVVVAGMLITTHISRLTPDEASPLSLSSFPPWSPSHSSAGLYLLQCVMAWWCVQDSLFFQLSRTLLHTAGMMAGWAFQNWLHTALPADGDDMFRLLKAVVATVVCCVLYHLIRRMQEIEAAVEAGKSGDGNAEEVEMAGT